MSKTGGLCENHLITVMSTFGSVCPRKASFFQMHEDISIINMACLD